MAPRDLDAASTLASRLLDPVEGAIAWAEIVAEKLRRRLDASDALGRMQAAFDAIPQYVPELPDDDEQGQIWRYLSPRIRALVETAIRIAPWNFQIGSQLVEAAQSPYLQSVVMTNGMLCEVASASGADKSEMLKTVGPAMVMGPNVHDPLVGNVCRREAVASIAPVDAALAARIVASIEGPALKAFAELDLLRSDAAACVRVVDSLGQDVPTHHVAVVAMHAAAITSETDAATSRGIVERTTSCVEAEARPLARALGHQVLARAMLAGAGANAAANAVGHIRASIEATRAIGNGYDAAEVKANLLDLALASGDTSVIRDVVAAAIEYGWGSLVAALERAAPQFQTETVDAIGAAFLGALRVLDVDRLGTPKGIDGVTLALQG